jgi:uncharacterized protein
MKGFRRLICLAALWLGWIAHSQSPPPPPAQHVSDEAGVLSAGARSELNRQLETFERETSTQVVVWTASQLPAGANLEDYANRVFQAWKIGRRKQHNGVLLAVFTQDRQLRIEVGYGLEGALPDALCGRIIANEITPRFKGGDYEAGIRAGVNAILAATKGEYRTANLSGTAREFVVNGERLRLIALAGGILGVLGGGLSGLREGVGHMFGQGCSGLFAGAIGHPIAYLLGSNTHIFIGLSVLLLVWLLILARNRGWAFDHSGRHTRWGAWPSGSTGWSFRGGGGFGGSFSGGGGSSGGGGASGSW